MILIYTTHPSEDEAVKLCNQLLEERLIACYNLWPIKSAYWWKGQIQKSDETVAILKTGLESWENVEARIKELHSYDVPCIIKMDIEANSEYADWILNESQKQ